MDLFPVSVTPLSSVLRTLKYVVDVVVDLSLVYCFEPKWHFPRECQWTTPEPSSSTRSLHTYDVLCSWM